MKKILLISMMFVLSAGLASADCTIGLAWTPDPAQSAVTEQQVWYNPDGVANNGDEIMKVGTLAADVSQAEFTETGDCLAGHTLFVRTLYGTIEVDSAEISPQNVVGAIISIAVEHQQ
jgi:hypothetical protein